MSSIFDVANNEKEDTKVLPDSLYGNLDLKEIRQFEKSNNCISVQTIINKYGRGWYINNTFPQEYFIKKLNEKDSDSEPCIFLKNEYRNVVEDYIRSIVSKNNKTVQKEVIEFIKSFYTGEIIENDFMIINPLKLDIYIPDKKVAIEFDGGFWDKDNNKNNASYQNYHYEKAIMCEKANVRLIYIYNCEWSNQKDNIKSLLRLAIGENSYSRVYARDCKIKQISDKLAKPFNDANHLQYHRNAQVTYGLFYNNKLVQLMSFSKTKWNRNIKNDNEWEIIRGCPGSNNQVIGGVSKLFKHFIRDYNPDKVFSYCDFNKFDGKGYLAIGMIEEGYSGPNKFYIMPDGKKIDRNPGKRVELTNTCEYIAWGAGSKKFVWKKG